MRFLTYEELAWAGALPFVICAGCALAGVEEIAFFGPVERIALSYALAITSFLSGAHWATHLYRGDDAPVNLLLTSNVATLAAWFAFLLLPAEFALVVMAGVFAGLLRIDARLSRVGLLDPRYWRMRRYVTAVVIVALLATAALT